MFVELVFKLDNIELVIDQNVVHRLNTFRQLSTKSNESGGLLIGRTDINDKTKILDITVPMTNDYSSRYRFKRKDIKHLEILEKLNNKCLYFKGNWHTHPQKNPMPSLLDKFSWKSAMKQSRPGESKYIFFVIVGTDEIKVWCGNMKTHMIKSLTCLESREMNEI